MTARKNVIWDTVLSASIVNYFDNSRLTLSMSFRVSKGILSLHTWEV